MCGIFALLNNNTTFSNEIIKKAFDKGAKRGPEYSILKNIDNKTTFGFHRLAINGLDAISHQPLEIGSIKLVCNGEIYNYQELYKMLDVEPTTNSDCEIIIHLYEKYGIEHTVKLLDGVYAFILYDYRQDSTHPVVHSARDPYGVRPLYVLQISSDNTNLQPPDTHTNITYEKIIAFASEIKVLSSLLNANDKTLTIGISNMVSFSQNTNPSFQQGSLPFTITQFQPGTIDTYVCEFKTNSFWKKTSSYRFFIPSYSTRLFDKYSPEFKNTAQKEICRLLNVAVKKRVVGTSDRPIACLLSGGLDSSLITALVNKYYDKTLETYSIGMKGSEDLVRAREVAKHLGTKHTEIELTKEEFFNAIPETIAAIESYDTTTVRASVGNYLIGKYIAQHSEAKVIFNGDGSDELAGGYIYFLKAPDDIEFDKECRRLLSNISFFDVLRSDKSISSNGLEPRTPFLDRDFTNYYLSLPISIRNPMSQCFYILNKNSCEKFLLREAFSLFEPDLLPKEVLWRTKEAFSDGVSGNDGSWYQIIDKQLEDIEFTPSTVSNYQNYLLQKINSPATREQQYYREIYDNLYPNTAGNLPYFWMPQYVNATDSSARSLSIYNNAKVNANKSNGDTKKKNDSTNDHNANIMTCAL